MYRNGKRGMAGIREGLYEGLCRERRAGGRWMRNLFGVPTVLLCGEAEPEHCHLTSGPGAPEPGLGRHPGRSFGQHLNILNH